MEDVAIRRLVEMLSAFYTEGKAVKEDLTCSLTCEFLRNIQDVLFTKQIAAFLRWQSCFDLDYQEMASSLEVYLRYIFFFCIQDDLVNRNIFERFLNAFALILRITIELRLRTNMNFCKLIPDIYMVFYEEKPNLHFSGHNGFRQFVEYINDPIYLESKCVERNICSSYDSNVSIFEVSKNLPEKVWKIMRNEPKVPHLTDFEESKIGDISSLLANKVLAIVKIEFISFQNDVDLKANPIDLIEQKKIQISESQKRSEMFRKKVATMLTSERLPGLNFDTEINDVTPEQVMDGARWENVIEAVMRHNLSKSSSREKTKDRFQTQVDEILKHLKSKVESFKEVLDKYDKK